MDKVDYVGLATLISAISAAVVAIYSTMVSQSVKRDVNHRLDEMLELTRASAYAAGRVPGAPEVQAVQPVRTPPRDPPAV